MDLIYADETRKDIGVLDSYDLDMAYGSDENDFECKIDRNSHCCESGYFLYVEGEEYGGIVDTISVDTESDVITYAGRCWTGVLEGNVICPDEGQDYLILDGEANSVLQNLITNYLGLDNLFAASSEDSGIELYAYQMERYVAGYTGIKDMLKSAGAKLKMKWSGGKVLLWAEYFNDYSQDEEFDNSQVDFTITKHYRPVNHIICLGQGDLRKRAVIHIFSDENGGIQPYATTDDPVKDADYILDQRNKVLSDQDEVIEVYDCSNAEITTNYVLLTSAPANWSTNCESYYIPETETDEETGTEEATGAFKSVELEDASTYTLQKYQPADWSANYASYYVESSTESGFSPVSSTDNYDLQTKKPSDWKTNYSDYYYATAQTHQSVNGEEVEKYVIQKKRPTDWKKKYSDYYYYYTDGVTVEYKSVEGVSHDKYTVQTKKPTDWTDRYTSYYRNATAKELKKKPKVKYYAVTAVEKKVNGKKTKVAPTWKARTYYTKTTYYTTPAWKAKKYYTKKVTEVAPTWKANTYYTKVYNSAPTWAKNKYYTYTEKKKAPKWTKGTYYRAYTDRYAVMVADAIEKLNEYQESDELEIALEETEQTYDVGDLVGTIENTTGITATQEVVKKIIKISNNEVTISYEVN